MEDVGVLVDDDAQRDELEAAARRARNEIAEVADSADPMAWVPRRNLIRWAEAIDRPTLLVGDFNIAPEDRDVHDPKKWEGQNLVSPEERAAFRAMQEAGLVDAFRMFEQEDKQFSWWDYRMFGFKRNAGLRIDHFLNHRIEPGFIFELAHELARRLSFFQPNIILTAEASGMVGGVEVVLNAMTAAILPGYAPIELRWELRTDSRGRQVRVPHATLQPQRWFTLSGDRRRFLLRSETNMTPAVDGFPAVMGEELRPLAWLMHVHPARHGGLARSMLARVLFWPYLFKNYALRDFAEFLEIYGLPLRLGKYPTGASDDEKRTLLRAVTDIGHNAAGIIPQGMVLEFQSAAAGTEVPFAAMWDRLDAAESKAILGQTLTASEGTHGV